MSGEIINVLNALCEKLGIVVDWTGENVLPQIEMLGKNYVSYEFASSAMWLIISGVLMLIVTVIVIASVKHFDVAWDDLEGRPFVLATILFILAVMIASAQIDDMILCKTFPEKLIYELLTDTLKGM